MKKVIAITVLVILLLSILCGCESAEIKEKKQNTIAKIEQLQKANNSIDEEIDELYALYDNEDNYDEIVSSYERIDKLEKDISELKNGLDSFEPDIELECELTYDSTYFEKYNSIITRLYEWREQIIEIQSNKHPLGDYSYDYFGANGIDAIAQTNYSIGLDFSRSAVSLCRPDYYSVIDSLKEQ